MSMIGRVFETRVGLFSSESRHAETLLGRRFASGVSADEEAIFLDRDPEAFAVILNWYRYGKLLIPSTVHPALIAHELTYFNIPATIDEALLASSIMAPPSSTTPSNVSGSSVLARLEGGASASGAAFNRPFIDRQASIAFNEHKSGNIPAFQRAPSVFPIEGATQPSNAIIPPLSRLGTIAEINAASATLPSGYSPLQDGIDEPPPMMTVGGPPLSRVVSTAASDSGSSTPTPVMISPGGSGNVPVAAKTASTSGSGSSNDPFGLKARAVADALARFQMQQQNAPTSASAVSTPTAASQQQQQQAQPQVEGGFGGPSSGHDQSGNYGVFGSEDFGPSSFTVAPPSGQFSLSRPSSMVTSTTATTTTTTTPPLSRAVTPSTSATVSVAVVASLASAPLVSPPSITNNSIGGSSIVASTASGHGSILPRPPSLSVNSAAVTTATVTSASIIATPIISSSTVSSAIASAGLAALPPMSRPLPTGYSGLSSDAFIDSTPMPSVVRSPSVVTPTTTTTTTTTTSSLTRRTSTTPAAAMAAGLYGGMSSDAMVDNTPIGVGVSKLAISGGGNGASFSSILTSSSVGGASTPQSTPPSTPSAAALAAAIAPTPTAHTTPLASSIITTTTNTITTNTTTTNSIPEAAVAPAAASVIAAPAPLSIPSISIPPLPKLPSAPPQPSSAYSVVDESLASVAPSPPSTMSVPQSPQPAVTASTSTSSSAPLPIPPASPAVAMPVAVAVPPSSSSVSSSSSSVITDDIAIERSSAFKGECDRGTAERLLRSQPSGTYLFRMCGEPAEKINGAYNPNLFVLCFYIQPAPVEGTPSGSVAADSKMANIKIFRHNTSSQAGGSGGLSQNRDANAATLHRSIQALARACVGHHAVALQ
jgi:hypothetical protein